MATENPVTVEVTKYDFDGDEKIDSQSVDFSTYDDKGNLLTFEGYGDLNATGASIEEIVKLENSYNSEGVLILSELRISDINFDPNFEGGLSNATYGADHYNGEGDLVYSWVSFPGFYGYDNKVFSDLNSYDPLTGDLAANIDSRYWGGGEANINLWDGSWLTVNNFYDENESSASFRFDDFYFPFDFGELEYTEGEGTLGGDTGSKIQSIIDFYVSDGGAGAADYDKFEISQDEFAGLNLPEDYNLFL